MSIVKGLICSHCNDKIPTHAIHIKDTVEYEGVSVHILDCPSCGKSTDDLQSDYWVEETKQERK